MLKIPIVLKLALLTLMLTLTSHNVYAHESCFTLSQCLEQTVAKLQQNIGELKTTIQTLQTTIQTLEKEVKYYQGKVDVLEKIVVGQQTFSHCFSKAFESCHAILQANCSMGDGIYTIKPYNKPFKVFCDMTTDNGGWTYIANISDSDADKWSTFYPEQDTGIWADSTTLGNQITFIKDYKSSAYNEVAGTSLLIKEGERRNVLMTQPHCWTKQTFREFIAFLTWNAEGSDPNWADNSGAYRCHYTDFGYNDPVLRASTQTKKELGFKWGEKDGVQDGNKDRTMITTHNANGHIHQVDYPTGLGGFTSYGSKKVYEDANDCQKDGPDQCSSTDQNYQLFIR
jgi:hypothetical protein